MTTACICVMIYYFIHTLIYISFALVPLPRKSFEDKTPASQRVYEQIQTMKLSPRVRMGLRMYVNAAVPTLGKAAEAVGLSYQQLAIAKNSPAGKEYMETAHKILEDRTLETSVVIQRLGRRAIEIVGGLMEDAGSDAIRLKAAIDLADRAPETSKVHKMQVESFTLDGKDARAIAEALVTGRGVQEKYAHLSVGNYDKVNLLETPAEVLPDAQPSLGDVSLSEPTSE